MKQWTRPHGGPPLDVMADVKQSHAEIVNNRTAPKEIKGSIVTFRDGAPSRRGEKEHPSVTQWKQYIEIHGEIITHITDVVTSHTLNLIGIYYNLKRCS